MLLAAGEGTRLRPLTNDRPKAMVEIAGEPAVAYSLEWLRVNGATEVAINLFHRPDVLQAFVGDGSRFGVRVRYSVEAPLVLGTAGALTPLHDFFAGESPFVVLYGDVLTNLDLGPVIAQHVAMSADATMVVNRVADRAQSGMVGFGDDRRVTTFVEKPRDAIPPSEWGNTGIYVCGERVLDYTTRGIPLDFAYDVFPTMLAEGRLLGAFPTEADVFEFGTHAGLEAAARAAAAAVIPRRVGL